jgi:hypothetical protein
MIQVGLRWPNPRGASAGEASTKYCHFGATNDIERRCGPPPSQIVPESLATRKQSNGRKTGLRARSMDNGVTIQEFSQATVEVQIPQP